MVFFSGANAFSSSIQNTLCIQVIFACSCYSDQPFDVGIVCFFLDLSVLIGSSHLFILLLYQFCCWVVYLFYCFIYFIALSVLNLVKPEINALQNTKRLYSNYPLVVRSVWLATREWSDQFGR